MRYNAELLLVVEADGIEEADEFAESVKAEVAKLWSLKGRVVEASVEAVALKRQGGAALTALQERIAEVSEGNPGAITVLLQLAPELVEFLHEHGPRGSALWVLYKDECGEDVVRLAEVLASRASEFRS